MDLLPRIKQINRVKLHQADHGDLARYTNLAPAMTWPVRWEIIATNYDQVVKYATAIRTRTASPPAYQAMLEIGRAARTTFVARYLSDRDLQREIEEGLNAVICYGRGGEISTNRRDEVEMVDRRGLTSLFWLHVRPYGEVRLDLNARLSTRSAVHERGHGHAESVGVMKAAESAGCWVRPPSSTVSRVQHLGRG
ncbi:Tn3 family transposase [Streptosporangium sp. NPDC002544]|uniref:Tn3 family transposase n=1 Tax=Streptosporangium sp. NPDC002544 TaxID=3154538 RepID=UPI003330E667